MKNKRLKKVISDSIKKCLPVIISYFVIELVNLFVFILAFINIGTFIYPLIILTVCLLVYIFLMILIGYSKALKRERLISGISSEWKNLNCNESLLEEDYQRMVKILGKKVEELNIAIDNERDETRNYYITWVHQIKTPISVIHMMIDDKEDNDSKLIQEELFRIEQYVDMVLQYMRLESDTNDLVIKELDLDLVIKSSVRKYAFQFINKKLKLIYEGTNLKVVTDEKWLSFILDQLLSNAIKYTNKGEIEIIVTSDRKLLIRDTGIGIEKEDHERIFEKGYTGINGRVDKKSSGLGLYLVKRACDMLHINIYVESEPGLGSTFILNLNQKCEF